MKKQFLITGTIIMLSLLFACSKGDDSSENEETFIPETKQFLKSIQKQNPESWQKGSQFFYKNDKLEYVYLDSCSGELYYFEYNSDGKISKRYVGTTTFDSTIFNPSTFDLNAFKQNSSVLNYVYQNDKLTKMVTVSGFIQYEFSYNGDGTMQTSEYFISGIGLWEKVTFEYSGGKISKLNKKEYDTSGGGVVSNYNYTFEYDDKQNPFYTLAESFSLLGLYTCTGFDYISSEDMGLKLFKNNVTKVYRDEVELYSATYQYDNNGYPTRISYTNLNENVSGVDLVTYQ
jgi:hypothetical protein